MENETEILLVEDDLRDARFTKHELLNESPGRHIEIARDGEEALDFLFCRGAYTQRSPHRPPRLVLLDLKLPKVDGLQVLREIRNKLETRAIPVVALTSSREEKDRTESYRLGINSYLQKPVNFDEFRRIIQTLSLYWLGMNQPPPEEAFAEEQDPAAR